MFILVLIFLLIVFTSESSLVLAEMLQDVSPPPATTSTPQFSIDQINVLKQENIPKLSPLLNQIHRSFITSGSAQLSQTFRSDIIQNQFIRIVALGKSGDTEFVRQEIEQMGGIVTDINGNMVFATFPIDKMSDLAVSNNLYRLRTPYRSYPDAISEGVSVHNVNNEHSQGFTGQGIKVGVLDCGGFSGYDSLLGTELPSSVTLWSGGESGDPVGSDIHGTACAEIVHDMAPGAQMFIAYNNTENDFYNAVDWFISQGVKVISYSCSHSGDFPNDGLGLPYNPVNAKVSDARGDNVLWVNSAGNYSYHDFYHATFNYSGSGPIWHTFGDPYGAYNPVYISASSGIYVTLTWNDWPVDPTTSGSTQDYDLYIYDGSWNLLASSINLQDGTTGQLPFEEIDFIPPATGWYNLVIAKYSATGDHFLNLRNSGGYLYFYNTDRTITSPAENPDALSVGAIFWNDLSLEPFSSQGPTLGPGGTESGGFMKPDIVAADGVSTITYGNSDGETWMNYGTGFFGTSASCPHTAGAAAVLLSKYTGFGADAIESNIFNTAIDMGAPGQDTLYGHGMLYFQSRIEEQDPLISYTGWWNNFTCATCSEGALKYSGLTGSKASFNFNGTGIKWITAKGPVFGKAKVYLDGVVKALVDLYSPSLRWQVVLQASGLSAGPHTLRVEVSGLKHWYSKNYFVGIDAFEVIP
jgi:hypothetical protein